MNHVLAGLSQPVIGGAAAVALTDVLDSLRSLSPWVSVPALLATAALLAVLVDLAVGSGVRRVVRRSETAVDDAVLEALHRPIVATVLVGGVVVAAAALPADLRDPVEPFVGLPALTLIAVLWAWTVNRLGNRLLRAAGETDGPYASFAPVFSNLLTFAILLATLFGVLSIWNVDVTPLLASAGIVGIAVGFAAKDTVANFFGGLALYVDRTYQVGDFVALDSGDRGTVVKVGIRSTTLQTRDEVLVTVPNATLNASRIVNESAPSRRKRIRVPVNVAYGSDLDEVEDVLEAAAADERLVLDSPSPRIRFLRFGDSALEYELRCWVRAPTRETRARHALNRSLYRRFAELGIEIPFPQRTVHVERAFDARGDVDGDPVSAPEPSAEPANGSDDGATALGGDHV